MVKLITFATIFLLTNNLFGTSINVDPHVKKFEELSNKKVTGVTAKAIDSLHHSQGGYFDNNTSTMNINPVYWKKHPKYGQEMVVFALLGHHVLKRKTIYQSTNNHDDLCPKSIMHWALSVACYKKHRNAYHQDLFQVN